MIALNFYMRPEFSIRQTVTFFVNKLNRLDLSL
jgi:hypothetical protein